jgi:hypothetical protein
LLLLLLLLHDDLLGLDPSSLADTSLINLVLLPPELVHLRLEAVQPLGSLPLPGGNVCLSPECC